MSIANDTELEGMKAAAEAVAITLKEMTAFAKPGISTKELDDFGLRILESYGAKSAPLLTYNFPGATCISVDKEFCHGIPAAGRILQEGELINIDVSAELNGFWADNGCSFVIGKDIHGHQKLVDASKMILQKAIDKIRGGVKIADVGRLMESEAKKQGYKVIRNLAGHGVGRSLHEAPNEILNYGERMDMRRFRKNSVVAIETFISTRSSYAETGADGWTMTGDRGGYMAQHEHTIVVTEGKPIILTAMNGIWN